MEGPSIDGFGHLLRDRTGTAAMSSSDASRIRFTEPKCSQQLLATRLTEPGDPVERRLRHPLPSAQPVIGEREPVCLVADLLQEVESLRRPAG